MSKYKISSLAVDLEKKLSLYKQEHIQKQNYSFNDDKYLDLVQIILKISEKDIAAKIENYNEKYSENIILENNKLNYPSQNISAISSELFKTLYYKNKNASFKIFIDFIQNNLVNYGYDYWFHLSFDSDEIKKYFLDEATSYIIENQISSKEWIEEFKKLENRKYTTVRSLDIKKIPKTFDDMYSLFSWFTKNENSNYLIYIGSNLIHSLLYQLIDMEEENQYLYNDETYPRINRIIDNCMGDYIIMGNIFTSLDVKLNIYFLTQKNYALYGFLNLYNFDSSPRNLSNDNIDYTKQWQEMLSKQLMDILFEHFKSFQYNKKTSEDIYNILNYITQEYVNQHNPIHHYKANYVLQSILDMLVSFKVKTTNNNKEYLFDLIINEINNKQLESLNIQNSFSSVDYFLLSWYLEQLNYKQKVLDKNYDEIKNNITDAILNNLEKAINQAIENNYFNIHDEIIEKIDFGLMYSLSKNKDKWLNLLDVKVIKEKLNGDDKYYSRKVAIFYFNILMKIYNATEDKNVAITLNDLSIEIGINEKYGILFDKNYNKLTNDFLEIMNNFNDILFEKFTCEFYKQNNIKNILQLYYLTLSESRKNKIENKIGVLANEVNNDSFSNYIDLENAIAYASNNGFKSLSNKLIDIYKNIKDDAMVGSRQKEYDEIVCKKEMLDIYYDNSIELDDKLKKLNSYALPFDDKNHVHKSKQLECERHRKFVKAIIFYEKKPIETYQILKKLCEEKIESLYLINMLNSYFEHYKNDSHKIEKYKFALDEYNYLSKKISEYSKSLYDYNVLLHGYMIINNVEKFMPLWDEMPKYFQYNFNILEVRCEFLQNNNQSLEAIDYIKKHKEFHIGVSDEESKKLDKLMNELKAKTKLEVEQKLHAKVDLQSNVLTLYEAQNHWNRIKRMSDGEHAQIFQNTDSLDEFIKKIMFDISEELLDRKNNISRTNEWLEIEDIINDWVTSLLQQKMSFINWKIKDQTRGGCSSTGKNPGEKDILVKNQYGNDIFLFEAFRFFSINKKPQETIGSNEKASIKEHVDKLDYYNATGCSTIITMIYTYNYNFSNLNNQYVEYLKTIDYKGFDSLSTLREHKVEEEQEATSTIKIYSEIRFKNSVPTKIYHYLLDFS